MGNIKMAKIKVKIRKKIGLFRTEILGEYEVEGTLEEIRAINKEKLAGFKVE